MEEKFLELFQEALDTDKSLSMGVEFRQLDEWDSLANLSVIAMLDEEYGAVIEGERFRKMRTLSEVFDYVKSL